MIAWCSRPGQACLRWRNHGIGICSSKPILRWSIALSIQMELPYSESRRPKMILMSSSSWWEHGSMKSGMYSRNTRSLMENIRWRCGIIYNPKGLRNKHRSIWANTHASLGGLLMKYLIGLTKEQFVKLTVANHLYWYNHNQQHARHCLEQIRWRIRVKDDIQSFQAQWDEAHNGITVILISPKILEAKIIAFDLGIYTGYLGTGCW